MFKKLLLCAVITLAGISSYAQPVRVAVAANAQFVLKKLADDFKKRTGISVEVISGASGKLAVQIKNGAPYDIFLSADMDFAENLYTEGFTLSKPRIYALGSLIVCSSTGTDLKNWTSLITAKSPGKIAIGNPKVAPYGKAAEEALNYYKVYQQASERLVFAESISQVNTYVLQGVVSLGFTTQSLVYELPASQRFQWQKVNPLAYAPIEQGAVLLKYSKNKNYLNNKKFFDYLFSAGAKAIFRQFGYTIA
ncbi:molybdate transport system substrate-binding protein [Pedobacter westerhofensis]|uniref:Molybdate transport system substrate-binding protein n=1 Tax=Pedobacter westerhofensis TaxID=425512 RepID=A0A521FH25_9SPHI|nr:molybdate ABC transporter substrate-binding protein [Pedobacter westerhofensis]SMO95507.1 molybdate transport system substrate-binding protein [Pedobacter westerhofensis]